MDTSANETHASRINDAPRIKDAPCINDAPRLGNAREINVIEITDYAEKPSAAEPTPRSEPTKRRHLRHAVSALGVTVALLFIVYRLVPVIPVAAKMIDRDLLILATFGAVAQVPPVTDSEEPEPASPLPPLSHSIGSEPPLGTFDDDALRQILYESSMPDCGTDEYPIKPSDLSVNAEYGLHASNETAYELDLPSYLDDELGIDSVGALAERYGADAPVVLIVHTHGTEAYAENGADTYSTKDNCRTADTSKNVVAVGAVMAEYFNSVGIPTLHCTEMFDADSYIDAYDKSSAAVREFTAIYPSIQYVFDIHRDSVIDSDLTKLRPVTVIDGELTAQYMCVVGTDERAGYHTEWERNLAFACQLQSRLWQKSNSLTRRMSIRSASYNQLWAPGSLLLEIGSCGNTLDEAKACAKTVAEQIAAIILEQ